MLNAMGIYKLKVNYWSQRLIKYLVSVKFLFLNIWMCQ